MATNCPITDSTAATSPMAPAAARLPFTGRRPDGGVNLWCPADVSGDWAEQCRVGREYGREAVDYIRERNDASMLPNLVRTIAERGVWSGVEVGFFTEVSLSVADAE